MAWPPCIERHTLSGTEIAQPRPHWADSVEKVSQVDWYAMFDPVVGGFESLCPQRRRCDVARQEADKSLSTELTKAALTSLASSESSSGISFVADHSINRLISEGAWRDAVPRMSRKARYEVTQSHAGGISPEPSHPNLFCTALHGHRFPFRVLF
jgi:hypothetical protein